jgi:hypothetical protein
MRPQTEGCSTHRQRTARSTPRSADGQPSFANSLFDVSRRFGWVLVLPHPDHNPPRCVQCCRHDTIAIAVPLELRRPVLGVGARSRPVCRASMPEAAVYEYGDPQAGEGEVGTDCERAGVDTRVAPVTKAARMDGSAQGHLWLRVPLAVGLHHASRGSGRCRRRGWPIGRRGRDGHAS